MDTTITQPIALDLIDPGSNDRKAFSPDALSELAASLAEHGLAQPVTLRPRPNGRYQLVCGERRTRAARLLGWTSIPALVRDLDDRATSAIMLAENTARADLSPLEEAAAYAERIAAFGITPAEVATWAGVSTFRVTIRLKLLALIPEAVVLVNSGSLPIGFAARLSDLDNNRQRIALRYFADAAASGKPLNQWAWSSLTTKLLADQNAESMFDTGEAFLQTATFGVEARESQPSTKKLRKLLHEMVKACEAAGVAPELTAEVRATLPRSWSLAVAS